MEEITKSDNSDNNEEKNLEEEENMDVGDFSSNLEGYPSSKGETSKEEMDESNDKNTRLGNVGEEDTNQSEHSLGVRDVKEVMVKEKEELTNKDVENVKEDTRKEKNESMGKDVMGKEKDESFGRDTRLSFLHTAKLKVDFSLQANS